MAIEYLLKFGTTSSNLTDSPIVPQSMEFGFQDVDFDSGRTADGTMHRSKVAEKRKISLTFPPCGDGAKMAHLLNAIDAETFYCRYVDPKLNAATTKQFYAGDRAVPVYSYALGLYDELTVNIIEV